MRGIKMSEKYIIRTVEGSNPVFAQNVMNQMYQQGYKVLAVSHGHVSGTICFIITFERQD